MITIKLDEYEDHKELFVKGHADYDVQGKDIVCAAVSILVYTLLESIDESILKRPVLAILNAGNTYVRVDLGNAENGHTEEAFNVVSNGFAILAKDFPKNVEFFRRRLIEKQK